MNKVNVFQYDAFSPIPNRGNPAGVVLHADHLSEEVMQSIARKVGFNETVFVLRSSIATVRLRYFTPGHEINLCGHATMASLCCLKTRGMLSDKNTITIETNVGILPIEFSEGHDQYDPNALMHARHFSSPHSGTIEDPITGTASGVMGAYYLTFIKPKLNAIQFTVEQGQEINKDGRVYVEAQRSLSSDMSIHISGTAVLVREWYV